MTHGRLTPLQGEVLDAFFGAEREFFLSGGAALVGFHLQHRETTGLDLFTSSAIAFERARIVLPHIIGEMGATIVLRQDSPGFRRAVVRSHGDELVVDPVRDIGPQLHAKLEIEGVIVDPIEEIFSNKLTTLVSRQEVRDLVDVLELERRGLQVESFLAEANEKNGGCTPATLAFLLSEWTIPENSRLPPNYSVSQLRTFKESLAERLVRAAHPR